jgi:hypothetical protein
VRSFTVRIRHQIIKEDEVGGASDAHGVMRSAYKSLVGKPEGERPFGRPRRKWECNIKIDPTGWGLMLCSVNVCLSGWGLVSESCQCSREPLVSIKDKKFLDQLSGC